VEQTTPNIFTTSVGNLLPDQEVRVEIRYLQPLPFETGQYRFVIPMVVSPRYILGSDEAAEPLTEEVPAAITALRLPQGLLRGDTVSLEVDLDTGVPLCGFDSPSHDIVVLEESGATRVRVGLRRLDEIPNRDFVLSYRVAGPRLEHTLFYEPSQPNRPGTFLLLATPPVPQLAPSLPWEVIFVIDRSTSMEGAPLEQARQSARQLLDRLDPQDAFNFIAFDTQLTLLAAMPLTAEEAHLRRARIFLDQIQAGGNTEMLEPLRLALQMPPAGGRERVRMLVFLTDGSIHGERELLAALRPAIGRSRIVAFGIGTAVNRHLLKKLTAAGRGFAEFLFPNENIARVVDRTLKRLSHAVLTDVELQWEGSSVEDVLPERCPDVYRDKPLMVLGRFRGAAPPTLTIQGRLAGEPYAVQLSSPHMDQHEEGVPLAVLWARQCIEELMDRIWEQPHNEPSLRRQVIKLAKQYRLSSPFTSFLAVEYRSQAEREQGHGVVTAEIPQYMPQGMGNQDADIRVRPAERVNILNQIIDATPQTERSRGEELIRALVGEALQGTVTWDRNVTKTIKAGMKALDEALSKQLAAIMHHKDFQKLEGTWRGLHYLVHRTETDEPLNIRVWNVSKRELFRDAESAVAFDQSVLFKKVYEAEFHRFGEPVGLLVGDYEFDHQPEGIHLLRWIAKVAALSHVPFVAAASPRLFNLQSYTDLKASQDLTRVFEGDEYVEWNKFRESDHACYIGLTLPRILARLPYGAKNLPIEEFEFEELTNGETHGKDLWMSAIWAFAACVTDAYAKYGWFERICGVDGCGKVEGMPVHLFPANEGSAPVPCSVELAIADRRQTELGELGFLPLLFCRDKDAIAFLEARSSQKQRVDGEPPAQLELKLNHLLGAARFIHYLTFLARGKFGSGMSGADCERWLNEWINNYVQSGSQSPSPEQRSRYPLTEAHVEVQPNKNKPGRYELVVWLCLRADSGQTARQRFIAEVPTRI
jgi:type VI secretion system protein ImpC